MPMLRGKYFKANKVSFHSRCHEAIAKLNVKKPLGVCPISHFPADPSFYHEAPNDPPVRQFVLLKISHGMTANLKQPHPGDQQQAHPNMNVIFGQIIFPQPLSHFLRGN